MAYNYCTHGYTMPFWGKAGWAREIDWLALHGVNMALIIEGQDAVWQNTFSKIRIHRRRCAAGSARRFISRGSSWGTWSA